MGPQATKGSPNDHRRLDHGPLTEKLPINTTMWALPSGCTQVSSSGASFFVCGQNWLQAIQSDKGTCYAVVAPPP